MKRLIYTIFLLLTIGSFVFSQSCLPNGITFKNQQEVDDFPSNHPGCTEIEGNVSIGINWWLSTDISNLDSLAQITAIGGDLEIKFNPALTSLVGLNNLNSIGKSLQISNNDALTSLAELNNLNSIGFSLIIKDNATLTSLAGLNNLNSIVGYFHISNNDALTSLAGLDSLNSIGGDFSLKDNGALASLAGLDNLNSIGYLHIHNNDTLASLTGLENLNSIGEGLRISDNAILTSLAGLSNLNSIGGGLTIKDNTILASLAGLNNLNSIGGRLHISGNDALTSLSEIQNINPNTIQSQYSSIKDLSIYDNPNLSECAVQSICDFLGQSVKTKDIHDNMTGCKSVEEIIDACSPHCLSNGITFTSQQQIDDFSSNFSWCSVIDGDVIIGSDWPGNSSITNLDSLTNITSIGGSLFIGYNTVLSNIDGLTNLNSIGKSLSIISNPTLPNIDGLDHLNSIGEGLSLEFNGALSNIDGLTNLTTVGDSLAIFWNASLNNIDGLINLNSVGGFLDIVADDALTNIDGLANLNSIGGYLDIAGNDVLTNIDGLANLNSIGNYLEIRYNDVLSDCCGIQELIATPGAIGGSIYINNNPSECSNESEILAASCEPLAKVITGKVFYDINQNKICDPDEGSIQGQKIWFNPPGHSLLANQDGKYSQLCDSGTLYQVNWIQDPDWSLTTDSASYQFNFTPGLPSNLTKDFGLYPNFTKHEGKVNLSSNLTRCNTDVKFFLRAENLGTYMESGYTLLHYDPSCTFISVTPASGAVVDTLANTLVWYYDSLYPFQYLDMEIIFGMPDQNSTNESLLFLSEMHRDSSGTDLLLDSYTYSPIIQCSFDPNDKQVMPSGERDEHYTLHDQKLTYTIRFQNTGNAEAIDIRILDTLDADLDINTLRIVNSSFPVQTSVKDQAMEFFFKNIWLPDSTSNEPESHGFVTYEIQPKPGLADYTEIQNTAYIIFDSNDAIVTNTTTNTMVTTIPVALNEPNQTQISIHPNPANNLIYISAKNGYSIDKVLIYNNLGELVLAQKDAKVDVSHLPKGLYLVKVQAGEKMGVVKLIRL